MEMQYGTGDATTTMRSTRKQAPRTQQPGPLLIEEGKDVGMGGAYDVGLHRIAWVIEMITDWMGDSAHLAEAMLM